MGPRRSKRISGEKLGNKIDDLEAHGRATYYLERRAGWEAKHADVECKFNIFDLLVELRLKIYGYAMATEEPRSIIGLKLPVLAMVSKQVRAEALPIFFAECHFTLGFMSNYPESPILAIIDSGDRAAMLDLMYEDKPLLARLKQRENIAPAFRNIELVVRAPYPGMQNGADRVTMIVRIPTAPKLTPIITWAGPVRKSEFETELAKTRIKAEAKAMEVATSRRKFVGYTLQDLEEVALAFKY
ncbi:hypothetical protein LTR56_002128 [Elasticomyces elasticus]|nr:hypothetical protein LTR56_002128 [Elasticomyces elasticus]KAK3666007.1 hypothetical protein LTR22_003010 [Elasticomyces elasticus]KAK4929494.1 hypothetical protein LTR49_003789 [Elasticomyces elasticus]